MAATAIKITLGAAVHEQQGSHLQFKRGIPFIPTSIGQLELFFFADEEKDKTTKV